ncbi:hypothetical protein UB46_31965 [Burkholderiaceae bacterium 16]|nr:hypothetical protein UB46_31965 [Burkholderiaceae bacterium 16]
MAVLLGSDWDLGLVGLSIVSALGRYKRMECAKAGQVIANRPQTQAGLGKKFLEAGKMAPTHGARRL